MVSFVGTHRNTSSLSQTIFSRPGDLKGLSYPRQLKSRKITEPVESYTLGVRRRRLNFTMSAIKRVSWRPHPFRRRPLGEDPDLIMRHVQVLTSAVHRGRGVWCRRPASQRACSFQRTMPRSLRASRPSLLSPAASHCCAAPSWWSPAGVRSAAAESSEGRQTSPGTVDEPLKATERRVPFVP